MSFTLVGATGITILPNPTLGNNRALSHGVNYRLSMTGTVYTYKRKHADTRKRTFEYTFENIGHEKIVELQEFFRLFGGEQITITTHNDEIYTVYFQDDNLEFTTDQKSIPLGSVAGRTESGSFTLRFIEA